MITAERSIVYGFGILFWTCLVAGLPLVALGLMALCFLFIFAGGFDLARRKPKPSPPTQEMPH